MGDFEDSYNSIMADQISGYLKASAVLDPHQSAYRRSHSIQTALIEVLDDIRNTADKRKVTVAVFFNFTNAFDHMSRYILIGKLKNLDFSSLILR